MLDSPLFNGIGLGICASAFVSVMFPHYRKTWRELAGLMLLILIAYFARHP